MIRNEKNRNFGPQKRLGYTIIIAITNVKRKKSEL